VRAVDSHGNDHLMFLGGQMGEQEGNGNLDEMYEYNPLSDRWIQRSTMPLARGHASSSTVPYHNCGFLMAGGAINGEGGARTTTNDISYYDIATDAWTMNIGQMYMDIKTPVCGIYKDYLYCTTGYTRQSFRRKLGMVPTMP
jgi:N-acetylneuraminic acid mutarotase